MRKRISPKDKLMNELTDKRTELVAEFFSKPKKQRKKEIEKEIDQLDQKFRETL